jgi:hypothetical protein
MSKDFLDKTSGKFEVVHEKKKKRRETSRDIFFGVHVAFLFPQTCKFLLTPNRLKREGPFLLGVGKS